MTLKIDFENQIWEDLPKSLQVKSRKRFVIMIFFGKKLHLVACATVCSKSGVILPYNNTSHADCLVVLVLRKEGRNFIMMLDKKPCANYAQRAKQMQYRHRSTHTK